jgi:protein arginine N-methyltransferase 2
MRHKGWHKRPGVRILAGRWQDILCKTQYTPNSAEGTTDGQESLEPFDIGKFDIVYFDTFMEGYRGHMEFIKLVPRLLRGPGSRFSFFNGHGQKSAELYQVRSIDRIMWLTR